MYFVFLNPQGNFDHLDSYWTMHPDFGGQLVYVKEIASALALLGHKVDIITRKFVDSKLSGFEDTFDYYDETKNPRIVRIECGPPSFLNKEELWSYLPEWVDRIIHFFKKQNHFPDFVTGHYGDGGYSAVLLKQKTGIPFSFTGHSLGAQKLEKMSVSKNQYLDIDEKFHFTSRIHAERLTIENADIIFVSTEQERDEQYVHPLYIDKSSKPFSETRFVIAPPGANTKTFSEIETLNDPLFYSKFDQILTRDISTNRLSFPYLVLASRLDSKKNHLGLLKAYALDKSLQAKCNIAISVRGIDNALIDYSSAKPDEREILDQMMLVIKTSHLEGMVSFISVNSQNELASIYRYLAKKKSIFVLTSLYEPFGLAPIEAMSSGLPAVVTKNGGPKDVLEESNIKFGVLVDPFDEIDMAKGIHEMFKNYELYKTLGKERVNQKYTWFATAKTYLSAFENIIQNNAIHHQNQVFSDFLGLENTKIKILEFLNSCEVKK